MQPAEPGIAAAELPLLSVIVPTLDEEAALPVLLADLARQRGLALEVLVGDGGSTDNTAAIARAHGAAFIPAARGRGAQMNAAAVRALGRYLLFLHADSRLDDTDLLARALACLRRAEQDHPPVAGHFRLRFLRSRPGHDLAYRFLEAKTGLNRAHTTNGDQGMLLSRAFFERLGGFDSSLPFLEDQRLAAAIRAQGRWLTLPGTIATSARRFESEGFFRRYLLMGIMMGMYAVGEERFFARAPGVYRVQAATGRLLLGPVFGLLWTMVRKDWGPAQTARIFLRLGRLLRENAWQAFLLLDVWLRPNRREDEAPLLRLHDRPVAPCLDFWPMDVLAGALCFFWFMVVLAAWFGLESGRAKLVTPSDGKSAPADAPDA
ncbi:TIGR04283 family arsenosugar biosynthesis glycosyltransferase [Desulfobulbus sp.]|uniref:TIGR04283 family arsenosugar biosynthesis glycosyltransferase n=1 Tax=Desulfobulbus sp. TaxID=895 RepID=UPI00286F8A90|nr:TIGR04283 family arsenosugar biosynthesis glycosyltransferase [Desulfobulbus sp.]